MKCGEDDLEDVLGVKVCLGEVHRRAVVSVSVALSYQQTLEMPACFAHQIVLQFATELYVTFT